MSDNPYRGHRFPREIISECVWLYFRFGVSFRDVEEMMAARGVRLTYETVRCWCDKFGKQYADGLRRRRARTGDKWHLDEVFLKINGVTHYLESGSKPGVSTVTHFTTLPIPLRPPNR